MSRIIKYKEHDEVGNIIPGLMKCDCGLELEMYRPGADIHCDCGRSYNSAGQMLAPREQWGEEQARLPPITTGVTQIQKGHSMRIRLLPDDMLPEGKEVYVDSRGPAIVVNAIRKEASNGGPIVVHYLKYPDGKIRSCNYAFITYEQ